MARGHQKIQAQQKNAAKQAQLKKGKSSDQKKAAAAALTFSCSVCKVSAINKVHTWGVQDTGLILAWGVQDTGSILAWGVQDTRLILAWGVQDTGSILDLRS